MKKTDSNPNPNVKWLFLLTDLMDMNKIKPHLTTKENEKVFRGKKCVVYVRTASGTKKTLVSQEELCRERAKARGVEVVNVFGDIGSGLSPDRKGLNEMGQFIRESSECGKKIDYLLVKDVSRITRSISCYLEIKNLMHYLDMKILSLDNNIESECYGGIYQDISVLFAECESRILSARMKAVIKTKKERISLENS